MTATPKQSAKKPPAPAVPDKAGDGQSLMEYFKGVRSEWGKVSWPTWPQIWGQTLVVLVVVSLMTTALWVIDNVFRFIIQLIVPTV